MIRVPSLFLYVDPTDAPTLVGYSSQENGARDDIDMPLTRKRYVVAQKSKGSLILLTAFDWRRGLPQEKPGPHETAWPSSSSKETQRPLS